MAFNYLPIFGVLLFLSCSENTVINSGTNPVKNSASKGQYAIVNGLRMYYEIYGNGTPLLLIHGGGSTIETSFGRIIPLLSKKRQLICVELQAHGHSGDRLGQISFEQDAADVAGLLQQLDIHKADVLGFSNGANTALLLGAYHPQLCSKIIAASPLLKRDGAVPGFWDFMEKGTFEQMPQAYKDAFLKINPDTTKLLNMFNKCAYRMRNFKDFDDDLIRSISCPVLLINGKEDVATSEHVQAMSKIIPDCSVAIFPGGHGAYLGEVATLKDNFNAPDFCAPLIENFLNVALSVEGK